MKKNRKGTNLYSKKLLERQLIVSLIVVTLIIPILGVIVCLAVAAINAVASLGQSNGFLTPLVVLPTIFIIVFFALCFIAALAVRKSVNRYYKVVIEEVQDG